MFQGFGWFSIVVYLKIVFKGLKLCQDAEMQKLFRRSETFDPDTGC